MFINRIKKVHLVVVLSTFVLGYIGVGQFVATVESKKITNEENVMRISYEIAENSNSIFDLQNEVNRLREKNDSFSFDLKDRNFVKEEMEKKVNNYSKINGTKTALGGGVEVVVKGDIITEEIVDLINGIRNTKPIAMGINNNRIIYRSYFVIDNKKLEFDNKVFDLPFTINVVGDVDILENSLTRSGGILDIIKQNSFGKIDFEVKKMKTIELPPYSDKIYYRYTEDI